LDFWKENFIVHLLCFISLLIFCLEVEVIKRLPWPLNELAAPFKNRKNCKNGKKCPAKTAHFRAREKFIKKFVQSLS